MRPVAVTLAALLLAVVVAQAQPPAAPPGTPPAPPPGAPPAPAAADPRLDTHLAGWENTMKDVANFHAEFELKRTEAVFKKDRKYVGSVLCMKPNFARLRLENATNKDDYEAYICNGKSVYEYRGLDKTITEFKLTGAQAAAGGDNLMLDFLSGMKAADAKKRFQIALFKEDEKQIYAYLDIKPVLAKDKQEFEQVRFALFGPGAPANLRYLPAQVWVLKPNGDQEMWAFGKQQTNLKEIGPQHFQFQEIKGWTFKQAPVAGPMGVAPPGPGGPAVLPGGTGLPAGPGAVKP